MKKLIVLIESAYCWEGDATARHLASASTPDFLVFKVDGSSTCEHGGDEDGIRSNVSGLRKQSVSEDGFVYTIQAATLTIGSREYDEDDEDQDRDGDYSVSVTGRVTVKKTVDTSAAKV